LGFYAAPVWRNRVAVHFPDRRDTAGPCEAPHHGSIKVEEAPSQYSCADRDLVAGQHAESDATATRHTCANCDLVAGQHAESDAPAARYTCANRDAHACGHSDP
jgi:hypothetical protein